MLLRLIGCDVFTRVICSLASRSPHVVDVEFVPMLSHNYPDRLRGELQRRIDSNPSGRAYDAVLLGYGLCGNAIAGLSCPAPLIIPRVHDCCAMFMGSKARFDQEFGRAPSTRWCSNGYYERGYMTGDSSLLMQDVTVYKTNPEYLRLVREYGEENAEYAWTTMYPDIETDDSVYIYIDGYEFSGSLEEYTRLVEAKGKVLRRVEGGLSYLRDLVNGPWDDERFLTVPPGRRVAPVYDMDTVITSED